MSDLDIERHLLRVGNDALAQATVWTALLGVVGSVGIGGFLLAGGPPELRLALAASAWGALTSVALMALARRHLVSGAAATVGFALYSSMPTLLFLGSHAAGLPYGAGTFLIGPMPFLYAVFIVLAATLLRPGLPIFVAGWTSASLLGCFALARPAYLGLPVHDPTFANELTGWFVWGNKALMLVFVGLVAAAVTVVARRLAVDVLTESAEKEHVRRTFGRYVSDEVAAHVLAGGARGVRKDVVVLFSDIRGFTTWSEATDPEELVARLNVYFEAMVSAIHRHGGVVDKFIGDAVMAVFDGVLPLERPEDAALAAALAMQEELARLNAAWADQGLAPWRTGIGLHRGPVVLGSLGSEERQDFTVIGDAVNTASRLEGLTKELGAVILVSDALAAGLTDRGALEDGGEVAIRGREARLHVWRVRSPADAAG
ncbi:MAG: adenylate/guanylate cyclase domain-containing protein [Alphaproteobacteria bacterium]|nr:adenylate/guanylate cyclase domain-containing protein [Alphaproteobacteria bacterium]MCB9691396.1 adenylate/guanylate cyclase domain-containing protein [Alphaproteobacteria bacterium]